MPHYKRLCKSSWKKNFNARKMIEARFFPIYVLSNCLSRWGWEPEQGLTRNSQNPSGHVNPKKRNVFSRILPAHLHCGYE